MTFSREMLEASPVAIELGAEATAAAIDACLTSAQACTSCANSSLAEEDVAELSRCAALCEICGDICIATARTLSRPFTSERLVVRRLLEACVQSCTTCAEECQRHAAHHPHCALCAKLCRACIEACTELLEQQELKELDKLEGA